LGSSRRTGAGCWTCGSPVCTMQWAFRSMTHTSSITVHVKLGFDAIKHLRCSTGMESCCQRAWSRRTWRSRLHSEQLPKWRTSDRGPLKCIQSIEIWLRSCRIPCELTGHPRPGACFSSTGATQATGAPPKRDGTTTSSRASAAAKLLTGVAILISISIPAFQTFMSFSFITRCFHCSLTTTLLAVSL